MARYVRVLLFDALMALVIVGLYSPGLLALRPSDPSLLRAGLSIFLGILIAASLVLVNERALREPSVPELDGIVQADAEIVREVLATSVSDKSVGVHARHALEELDEVDRKARALLGAVARKFGQGSMTYDRYAAAVTSAEETVVRNAALLADRAQGFDGKGYRSLDAQVRKGTYRNDGIPDDVQEDKLALYQASLAEMEGIVDANERLLLELDRLASELDAVQDADGSQRLLGEIRDLSEQLKWYRDDA